MIAIRLPATALLVLAAIGTAQAGACRPDIDKAQAKVDAYIDQIAASGPTATESVSAKLDHQPTPASIAAAEVQLGEGGSIDAALTALDKARRADARGSTALCQQALGHALNAIGQ